MKRHHLRRHQSTMTKLDIQPLMPRHHSSTPVKNPQPVNHKGNGNGVTNPPTTFLRFSLTTCCSSPSAISPTPIILNPNPSVVDNVPLPPKPSSSEDRSRTSLTGTVICGTIYGHRDGNVTLCFQQDRLSDVDSESLLLLLVDLSIPTKFLAKEMQADIVRIALECDRRMSFPSDDGFPFLEGASSLRAVPIWTLFCNGRNLGFAVRRKPTEKDRFILKTVRSTSVGAGVIPGDAGDVMYMRANYRRVVGSPDSESYHLINPDEAGGQELSIFLHRK